MEKKKRKFNVVDLIVILAVVAAIVLVAYRYLNRPETGLVAVDRIDFTVSIPAIDASIAEFAVNATYPKQMSAAGSWVNGWVDNATMKPITVTEAQNVLGGLNVKYIPLKEYATITLYCHAEVASGDITTSLGTQELRIGRNFIVKTIDLEVTGIIDTFERKSK